jgi:hypothetical protein
LENDMTRPGQIDIEHLYRLSAEDGVRLLMRERDLDESTARGMLGVLLSGGDVVALPTLRELQAMPVSAAVDQIMKIRPMPRAIAFHVLGRVLEGSLEYPAENTTAVIGALVATLAVGSYGILIAAIGEGMTALREVAINTRQQASYEPQAEPAQPRSV